MSSEKSLATLKILSEHCMRYKLFLESANVFKDRWVQDGHNDDTLIILSITNNFLRPNPMRTFLSWPSGAGAEKKIELVISGEPGREIPWLEFPTRPLPSYNIQGYVDFIRSHLNSCNAHNDCNEPELSSNQNPSRLLKIRAIDSTLEVLLIETSTTGYTYTAVSHCWGDSEVAQKMPKTTRDNIQRHIDNWYSISCLTKTFQHAVDITWRLGLEYIWIDSLCIIQHDKDDWEKECRKMAGVYGGARLVISAAHAKDGNGGLYMTSIPYRRIEFQTWAGDTIRAVVTADELQGPARKHDMWKTGEQYWRADDLPLFERAWVFQERMLAKRIVHFTSSELVWECRSQVDCECGDLQDVSASWEEFKVGKSIKTKYFEIARWGNDLERLNFWHDITSQFSARNITHHSDRLPALASTARQIDMPGVLGRYLCGIWEDTIPRNLLWWSQYTDTKQFPRQHSHEATHVRSKDKSIPSWSWLSIEGRVSTWGKALLTLAKITAINYTLATDDPYGACEKGEIQLCAAVSPIKISISTQEDGSSLSEVHRESSPKRYPLIPDTQPFEYSEDELLKLQVIALQFSITHLFTESMILCREKGSAKYRRLGIANVDGELFEGSRFEVIIII